jgi:hypothetical protein
VRQGPVHGRRRVAAFTVGSPNTGHKLRRPCPQDVVCRRDRCGES